MKINHFLTSVELARLMFIAWYSAEIRDPRTMIKTSTDKEFQYFSILVTRSRSTFLNLQSQEKYLRKNIKYRSIVPGTYLGVNILAKIRYLFPAFSLFLPRFLVLNSRKLLFLPRFLVLNNRKLLFLLRFPDIFLFLPWVLAKIFTHKYVVFI